MLTRKKLFLTIIVFLCSFYLVNNLNTINAQEINLQEQNTNNNQQQFTTTQEEYYKGKVVKIANYQEISETNYTTWIQDLEIQITSGIETGKIIKINNVGSLKEDSHRKVKENDWVVLTKVYNDNNEFYYLTDFYRINYLFIILGIFIVTAIFFSGFQGLSSFIGLLFSMYALINILIPALLKGYNPILVAFLGAILIGFFSIYLSHGVNTRTTLAIISTFITLGISVLLAIAFVNTTKIFGLGTEEAFFLKFGVYGNAINLKGLLLAGIIIGTLGVLDDITTAQSAVVEELKRANPGYTASTLYKRAGSVGKEHISSLINTLVMAYAGASLPLMLLFKINNNVPMWVTLNSEFIAEEIIRTLVGSITLVLAVPISTYIAAIYYAKNQPLPIEEHEHLNGHTHSHGHSHGHKH